ncbi:MAG: phosphatase PAP2 family protein, partial [Verrucomicrobiota bacterium]
GFDSSRVFLFVGGFVGGGGRGWGGVVNELREDWRVVWGEFARRWRKKKAVVWGCLGFWLVTGLAFFWFDEQLIQVVQGRELFFGREWWVGVCKFLKTYADFHWFNLLGAVVMIGVGLAMKSARWRRVGLAFFLAGAMAGVAVQTGKNLIGRPRPRLVDDGRAESAYAFKGPTWSKKWHAYPSGHSAAVWASCVALGLRWRKGFWVCVGFAALVAWSRVYGNYHWPTDAMHGSALGFFFGWLWGLPKSQETG